MTDANPRISWPGWETVRLIGRGSYGQVYEIQRDVFDTKEKAALKVIRIPQDDQEIEELRHEGYDNESITSMMKNDLKNIVLEYSMMRKMSGCSNIVDCDDVRCTQHDDGLGWDIYIKMELLTPLSASTGTEWPEEQVIRIGTDICKALILCKRHQIVHRDIKPSNIFVSSNGDYKLGDFGIAKTMEQTSSGTKIGTYDYMAPEVYLGRPYGSLADIYSLGLVLYWLLNKRRLPFLPLPPALPVGAEKEEARRRRMNGEPVPPPVSGSDALKRIVCKACAFDPGKRYQSAEEFLRDLESLSAPARTAGTAQRFPAAREEETEDRTIGRYREEEQDRSAQRRDEDGTTGVFHTPAGEKKAGDTGSRSREKTELPARETPAGKPQRTEGDGKSGKKKGPLWIALGAILALAAILLLVLLPKNRGADTATPGLPVMETAAPATAAPATTPPDTAETASGQEGEEPVNPPAENEYRLGMGIVLQTKNLTNSAAIESCAAAVVLDSEGRIAAVRLDKTWNWMNVTGGQVDPGREFQTRREEGGMAEFSPAGLEWYEQADYFEQYVIGKTAQEVEAIETRDDGGRIIAVDEELYAGCTITITDLKEAVVKACRDEQGMKFASAGSMHLGLAVISTAKDSESAAADMDGVVKMYSDYAAVVMDDEGVILAALIDGVQPRITINSEGEILETSYRATKRELKEEYGMAKYSEATLEWYEQAGNFEAYTVGKTAEELRATETTVNETGRTVFADQELYAGVSIAIDDMLAVVLKAAGNA